MNRSDERITKALRDLEELLNQEKGEARLREQELHDRIPRLKEIDQELHNVAPNAIQYYRQSGERDKAKLLAHLKGENMALRQEKEKLLKLYGYPLDYAKIRYTCNVCKDTGFVDGKKCRCLEQRLIRMAYDGSNLGESLKKQHFGVFDFSRFSNEPVTGHTHTPRQNIEQIFDKMYRFSEDFPHVDPKNLFFFGNAGTGKTYLCSCLAKALMDRGYSVLYISAEDLCTTLERERFNRNYDAPSMESDMIQSADVLIIDDLGTEIRNYVTTNLLINCLNQRLNDGKSTIISSNLILSGIADNYSERLASRILGNYQVIELYGPDLRRKLY